VCRWDQTTSPTDVWFQAKFIRILVVHYSQVRCRSKTVQVETSSGSWSTARPSVADADEHGLKMESALYLDEDDRDSHAEDMILHPTQRVYGDRSTTRS